MKLSETKKNVPWIPAIGELLTFWRHEAFLPRRRSFGSNELPSGNGHGPHEVAGLDDIDEILLGHLTMLRLNFLRQRELHVQRQLILVVNLVVILVLV